LVAQAEFGSPPAPCGEALCTPLAFMFVPALLALDLSGADAFLSEIAKVSIKGKIHGNR
jgi:hypothetical protein